MRSPIERYVKRHLGQGRTGLQPRVEPDAGPPGDVDRVAIDDASERGSLRKESRGGHTREDYPNPDPEFAKFNFALTSDGGNWDSPITAAESPLLPMPDELKALLEEAH